MDNYGKPYVCFVPGKGLRLRVVPLSFSPSCVTRKKTAKKMAAWNPGGEKSHERRVPPFAWFSPPGFHAAIFYFAVFFRVTRDGLSERGTTRSLQGTHQRPFGIRTRSREKTLWGVGLGEESSLFFWPFSLILVPNIPHYKILRPSLKKASDCFAA